MTNLKVTPADAVLVAIDVSKLRNDVLMEMAGLNRRRRLVVLNTRPEHDRFIGGLLELGRPVIVGFEATGNYHRPLAWRLLRAGFTLRLVSSVATLVFAQKSNSPQSLVILESCCWFVSP